MKIKDLGHKNGMAHITDQELCDISDMSQDGVTKKTPQEGVIKNNFTNTSPKDRYELQKEKEKKLPEVKKLFSDIGHTSRFL